MKRFLVVFGVFLVLSSVLGCIISDNGIPKVHRTESPSEKPPSVAQVVSRIDSYPSFCWAVSGTSLPIPFFGIQAEGVKGCVNYVNSSAVYWIEDVNGRTFLRRVSSAEDDLEWQVIASTTWPELNIINFLKRVLKSGNVTEVKRAGDYYEFHLFLRTEYESNAGTIENPYIFRTVEMWNVTLVVNGNGKPLRGHLSGRGRGPSNIYGANWFQEGNFTIFGGWD